MWKKLILTVTGIIILLIILIGVLIVYVKPDQALNLQYKEIVIMDKVADMVKKRKMEVQLTEEDINNLLKKQLALQTDAMNDVEILGAQIHLQGPLVEADVNLRWKNKVQIAAKLFFQLEWDSPVLEIEHLETRIKNFQIPNSYFHLEPIRIPLDESLPKPLGIRELLFNEDSILIHFKLF
ncbi:hypothetical protein [Paenibacillus eucommiae]|uniref:DUF2140 family protein n=1 Tax=Paenibacillus eucommiae TaxID=1355755 RepID=A0ABS4J0H9_9BACL|nr:hypothetical protein [Paenibacillus eucommiae]MBP1993357.1 hypothetical protein [Paenibacillus eucommiae]